MGIKRRIAAVLSVPMVLVCTSCGSGSGNDANIGADPHGENHFRHVGV